MVTYATTKVPKLSEVCSASAELIGSNEDLIDKVLLCLPVRSLIRFKSVSRQWNSLISNRRLGLNHTLKSPNSRTPSGLFFYHEDFDNVHSVSLNKTEGKIPNYSSHPIDDSMWEIVQSCNGLILFGFEQQYSVRNIATNQQNCYI